jgi:AcrR family transcriptional regulator
VPSPDPPECEKKRGRPRSKQCHNAILDATAELLEERRYRDVSIEAIAERAGVGKQTIYKWWSSKATLAMEAYALRVMERIPAPDTGTIEGDLDFIMIRSCQVLTQGNMGSTITGLMADAQSDPVLLSEFRGVFIASRREMVAGVLRRATLRGELRADLDIPFAIDLLHGPLWYRMLLQRAPLDEAFALGIVRSLLPGMKA